MNPRGVPAQGGRESVPVVDFGKHSAVHALRLKQVEDAQEDHEVRIRAIERGQFKAAGMVAGVVGLMTSAASVAAVVAVAWGHG